MKAMIATVLTTVIVWCFAVWGLGLGSRLAYERGDYETAAQAAKISSAITPVQRHRPLFNRGTAWAAQGNLGPARLELERALARSSAADECRVRLNLAAVVERQGDSRADTPARAARFFAHAEGVLAAAPEECRPPVKQAYGQAQERLATKQQDAPTSPPEDEEEKDPKDAKSAAVERKSERAAGRQSDADRQQADQEKSSRAGAPDRPGKPW